MGRQYSGSRILDRPLDIKDFQGRQAAAGKAPTASRHTAGPAANAAPEPSKYTDNAKAKYDQRTRVADAKVESLRASRTKNQISKPAPIDRSQPKPVRPKKPGMIRRAGSRLLKMGRGTVGKGIMGKAGVVGAVATGAQVGGAIGSKLNENDTINKNFYRPISDQIAEWTGLADQNRAFTGNDPEATAAALARQQAAPGQGGQPVNDAPGAATDGATTPSGTPEDSSQDAAELDIYGQSAPADASLNAANPREIEGSDFSYAGKYGDTDVLTRPDPNVEGGQTQEFTDKWSAFSAQRPAQSAESVAAENARVNQSREQYERNTTMSDGRRAFGGDSSASSIGPDGKVILGQSSQEQLRDAQQGVIDRGENTAVLDRQLAEEGRTPEQRAAYAQDPASAYQTDSSARAADSKSRLDAFKYNQDQRRDARTDARADKKDQRLATKAAGEQVARLVDSWKDYSPKEHTAMMSKAEGLYAEANERGEKPSMTKILNNIFISMERIDGLPVLDEAGNIKMKDLQPQENNQMDAIVLPHT